jgi:hypothetical protein
MFFWEKLPQTIAMGFQFSLLFVSFCHLPMWL